MLNIVLFLLFMVQLKTVIAAIAAKYMLHSSDEQSGSYLRILTAG